MAYIWKGGCWIDKATGEPMEIPQRDGLCMPMIQSDIEAYKSPLGDYWVDGRRAQREDLKRNGCVLKEDPPKKFDREEYAHRKAQQAKELEKRRAARV